MAASHGVFSCTPYEFGPCLRTHQECYLLSFKMLVARVGAGDFAQFLPLLLTSKSDLISPVQTASLTPGRWTAILFLLTISVETKETNLCKIWMGGGGGERSRHEQFIYWPSGLRGNSYITRVPVTKPHRLGGGGRHWCLVQVQLACMM